MPTALFYVNTEKVHHLHVVSCEFSLGWEQHKIQTSSSIFGSQCKKAPFQQ